MLKCTILGCGGSSGVPQLACSCVVCSSNDPRNKRTRVSILVESENTKIMVDTSPDFRMQVLDNKITDIDAILYTHDHSDHVNGIDEIKPIAVPKMRRDGEPMKAYMSEETASTLVEERYKYIFKQQSAVYLPYLSPVIFKNNEMLKVKDLEIQTFTQHHKKVITTGFRFGDIAYSTDVNEFPEESFEMLKGVKVWIVDCLRYYWAPTHSHLDMTLRWINRVKPKLAILTHMAHDIDYNEIIKIIPKNVIPAFDGMVIS